MKATRVVVVFISVLYFITLINGQTGPVIRLSDSQKQIVLNAHNDLRSAVNAQSMPPLVWAEGLNLWATDAVQKKCAWEETAQSVRTNVAGYSYVGENIAAGSIPNIAFLLSGWASEKQIYTYGPMNSKNWQHIGHYTQQVWAKTYALACVIVNCTQSNPAVNFMLACNYGPGGNYLNQYPYQPCTSGTCPFITPSPGGATINVQTVSPSRSVGASHSRTPSRTPSASPQCTPKTCSSNSCGTLSTGCGSSLNCGNCASNYNCVNNVCVACSPSQTCTNKMCGTINNGCGSTVSCGTCSSGYVCENYTCTPNPVCKSCANAGANCGTITISGCPTQSCGTCASGFQCSSGKCQSIPCSTCPQNSACVSGTCQCLDGYEDDADGNGCTAIGIIPQQFSEVYASAGALNSNWVFSPRPGNLSGQPTYSVPELDVVNNVQTRLSWNKANSYGSLELTNLSAQVFFSSRATTVGLGLRYNQGSSRAKDAIQWNINSTGTVTWNLLWYGSVLNQGVYGKGVIQPNAWNQISIQMMNTNASGTIYATSTVSINNIVVVRSQPVRPYDSLGGAYLYSSGVSGWRNVTITTRTSLHTAIRNCMSANDWAVLVSKALSISTANVKLVNYTVDGECAGQGTNKKRQAVEGVGNSFIFSLESTDTIGSRALASQFIQLAQTWDDSLAATGGVTSVDYADPATLPSEPVDYTNAVDLTTLDTPVPATGGLSAGAIAGIVVGSVAGALIVAAIALAVVGAIVYAIVRTRGTVPQLDIATAPDDRRAYSEGNDNVTQSPAVVKEEETIRVEEKRKSSAVQEWREEKEEESEEDENKPRGAVDLYQMNPRHHASLSARVPEGYAGNSTYLKAPESMEVEVEEKD